MIGGQRPRVHHVDGPMLPHLNHFPPSASETKDVGDSDESKVSRGSLSLAPILTPPLSPSDEGGHDDDDDTARQLLLVPTPTRIVARSARNGRRICELRPPGEVGGGADGGGPPFVGAVALAWLPRATNGEDDGDDDDDDDDEGSNGDDRDDGDDEGEWIALAACGDGKVHEWRVADLLSSSVGGSSGVVGPRRSFRLTCAAIALGFVHFASVQDEENSKLVASKHGGAVLYGLAEERTADDVDEANNSQWLVRCVIPPFETDATNGIENLVATTLASPTTLRPHLKKMDAVFGLLAAYRPCSKSDDDGTRMDYAADGNNDVADDWGHVFVTVCAIHGAVVYRDDESRDGAESLVPLATRSKSRSRDDDADALTSAAVSPNARDLALGFADGRIEVLDDVFSNVASCLDKGARDGRGRGGPKEEDAVSRTAHWHAHPVRALSFSGSAADRDRATGLLSGGEESVLATWRLDRNSHRPSNYVARVGHGAIVSILQCPRSNRVVVFCSDDSVQCFDGTNQECVWKERGLATMALSHDEEEDSGGGRGPVIVVKDPITELPMLTNLPGAPGMVHWYDPRSASVVGTLEVAPYNRVSRRDPTDPHVPAPSVTHMAVGDDGKDMITVDAVWTENAGVGRARRPSGPRDASTNACTSIKFWSHVNSFKGNKSRRRNGEVPMGYELVSSMVAPHGRDGGVCALAVSPDGGKACTLSQEEDAFRLWVKNSAQGGIAGGTIWKCLYKVKTPSGYANLLSRSGATLGRQRPVAFSSDGTILSVSYGPCVSLWDHSNATLLASVTLDGDNVNETESCIQSVDFLTKSDDAMLLTTVGQIGVKSPFGGVRSCYLGEDEWSFNIRAFGEDSIVSASVPLHDFQLARSGAGSGGYFAVAITRGSKSIVSIISQVEGSVVRAEGTHGSALQWRIDGQVQSLCVDKCTGSIIRLLAITKDCQMMSLSFGETDKHTTSPGRHAVARTRAAQAPVLKVGGPAAAEIEQNSFVKRRKISLGISGRSSGGKSVLSEFDFPNSLNGKFTSAFIAKNLGVNNT